MRYDGVDWSEWQDPDPDWSAMGGHQFVVVRLCDGSHYDPIFADHWRRIQELPARWKGWYVLPNPNLGWERQLDLVTEFYNRSGVPFGQPGHFVCIDDEPTPSHGQLTGDNMRAFRAGLLQRFGRQEELHYVGAYNGNRGFCIDEGWPWWVPWPTSNGPLPSWCSNVAAWQWGVADRGEVPGFPRASGVDVNQVQIPAHLDRIAYGGDNLPDADKDVLRNLGVDI